MKEYHKNPRRLSEKQYANLQRDIHTLGDLGCIIHNLNTDEIISGNQRCKIIKPSKDNIELTESYDQPTRTGTVAIGYIQHDGERWPYRQVRWDEKTAERANIIANRAGGTWDFSILADQFDMDDLLDWGFEKIDFGMGGAFDDDGEPEDKGQSAEPKLHTCPKCGHKFED
jgi:hypothetical protein